MKTNQRVRRSPEQAREEILLAAMEVLSRDNAEPVTVKIIMNETGMTRSTFYHYYSSIEEICEGLLERMENKIKQSVDGWLDGDGGQDPKLETENHIKAMFKIIADNAFSDRTTSEINANVPFLFQEWQERIIAYFSKRTAKFIRRQVELGRSRIEDPDRIALALLHMNSSVVTSARAHENPEEFFNMASALAHIWNATIFDSL